MAVRIIDGTVTLGIRNCGVANALLGEHAAGDGNGAWIVFIPRSGGSGRVSGGFLPSVKL